MRTRYLLLTLLTIALSVPSVLGQHIPTLQPVTSFQDPLPVAPSFEYLRYTPPAPPEITQQQIKAETLPELTAPAKTLNVAPQKIASPYTEAHWEEGYRWMADVSAMLTGETVPYPDFRDYDQQMEDELMIAADLFFDRETLGASIIERNEAAIPTFLPFPDDYVLQERMRAIENEVPLTVNETTKKFIYYYGVRAHGFTRELRNRANIYFPLFEQKLRAYGMPDEIKYLAIIESALRPKIRSHAGATGLWQFMPRTGRSFGLAQNYYVDERMNPEQATEAACRYLNYLYGKFGDWGLALSAYNCGPGNLRKAIRRSGGKTEFWSIYNYLPRETRSYLPQFIAVMYLMSYPDEHFLAIDEPYYPIETATIHVNDYINLKRLADELMVCYDDLQNLNPELKRGIVPRYMGDYQLNIPRQRLSYFRANRKRILEAASTSGYYESVALTDGSAYSTFWRPVSRSRNMEYKPRTPRRTTARRTRSVAKPPAKGANKVIYKVKTGDTVSEIADRYEVSTRAVQYWNKLSNSRIYAGQHLTIWSNRTQPKPKGGGEATTKKTSIPSSYKGKVHTVRSGDTLWDIARKYGVSESKIRSLNNLNSDKLNIGQRLKLG